MRKLSMQHITIALCLISCLMLPALAFSQEAASTNHSTKCHNDSLKGTFGGAITGQVTLDGATTPLAFVATVSFDGHGNLSGSDLTSFGGDILPLETYTGTYSVNPDCTGNLVANTTESGMLHYYFTIVSDGGEIEMVGTDPGTLYAGSARRR